MFGCLFTAILTFITNQWRVISTDTYKNIYMCAGIGSGCFMLNMIIQWFTIWFKVSVIYPDENIYITMTHKWTL